MKFPMKKKYRNRHLILEVLHNKYQEDFRPDMDDLDGRLTFTQLGNATNLSDETLRNELELLDNAGETFYSEVRYTQYYTITQSGRIAYTDRKYLKSGEDEFWTSAKNYISLAAIVVSIIALCWNIYSSDQIDKLKARIEKIEKK